MEIKLGKLKINGDLIYPVTLVDGVYDSDARQSLKTTLSEKATKSELNAHTGNAVIHVTQSNKDAWTAKYDKPASGIPYEDLSSGVQESLDKAESAIQDISMKEDKANKVPNNINSENIDSEILYPSVKATVGYVSGVKSELETEIGLKADQDDFLAHIGDTNIHTNPSEKAVWTAKYDKPSTGIPKSDLAEDVKASLEKADHSVQENPEIDGATKCKITYDSKGLVTSGANLDPNDIPYGVPIARIEDLQTILDSKVPKTVAEEATTSDKLIKESTLTAAIEDLDVALIGESGKYVEKVSETDGKISAVLAPLPTYQIRANQNPGSGNLASYYLEKTVGDTTDQVGVTINIPSEKIIIAAGVIQYLGGSKITINGVEYDVQGTHPNGTYIVMIVSNSDQIWIPSISFVYTSGSDPAVDPVVIEVSADNKITAYLGDGRIAKTKLTQALQDEITGKEDKVNKVTSISGSSTNTQYPSAKAVYDVITENEEIIAASLNDLELRKEDKANKVTSISGSSTDTQYPSAKAVWDLSGSAVQIEDGVEPSHQYAQAHPKTILRDSTHQYFPTKTSVSGEYSHLLNPGHLTTTGSDIDLKNELGEEITGIHSGSSNLRRYTFTGFADWWRINAGDSFEIDLDPDKNWTGATFKISTAISINGQTGKVAADYTGVTLTFTAYSESGTTLIESEISTDDIASGTDPEDISFNNVELTSDTPIAKIIITGEDKVLFNWYEIDLSGDATDYWDYNKIANDSELQNLSDRVTTDEATIRDNTRRIGLTENGITRIDTYLDNNLGDIQIWEAPNNRLPRASAEYRGKILRQDGILWQCVSNGISKDYSFSEIQGTSEITTEEHFTQVTNLVTNGFKNDWVIVYDEAQKFYRNSGELRVGTSGSVGYFAIQRLFETEDGPTPLADQEITSMEVLVKTWTDTKNGEVYFDAVGGFESDPIQLEASGEYQVIEIPEEIISSLNDSSKEGYFFYINSSEGYGDKRLRFGGLHVIYGDPSFYWKKLGGGADELVEEVSARAITELNENLDESLEVIAHALIEEESMKWVTYAELKELRDNGKLIPGQQYRITDYECTTTQEDTRAQTWRFDIIVTADDEKTLNENARAAYHEALCEDTGGNYYLIGKQTITNAEGNSKEAYVWEAISGTRTNYKAIATESTNKSIFDPESSIDVKSHSLDTWTFEDESMYLLYDSDNDCIRKSHFEKSNLEAWELKYCLDNDNKRFAWAYPGLPQWISSGMLLEGEHLEYQGKVVGPDGNAYHKYGTQEQAKRYYGEGGWLGWILCDYNSGSGAIPIDHVTLDSDYCSIVIYNNDESDEALQINDKSSEYDLRTRSKGVIYYMKDEWNNECPYDFKNIQFKRYYDEDAGYYKMGESENNEWCYTFCMLDRYDGLAHDVSVEQYKYPSDEGNYNTQYNNVIKPYYDIYSEWEGEDKLHTSQRLNDIVFVTDTDRCSIYDDYSYGEFSGYYSNTFGNFCYSITFGNGSFYNTFSNYCYNNIFGNSSFYNTFSNGCYYNTFGNGCYYNTFGNNCDSNTFGNFCYSNIFDNNCYDNIFDNDCYRNTFGNNCHHNTFGNNCNSNIFGNDCYYNTFGSSVASTKDYYQYITYENGVCHTILNYTATTSDGVYCQNVHVNSGVSGSASLSRKVLTVATSGNNFTTEFGMNSAGELKSWNPADLIN